MTKIHMYSINKIVKKYNINLVQVPDKWILDVVAAYTVRPKGLGLTVSKFELRAFDPSEPGNPRYFRKRTNEYSPIILFGALYGNGSPKWMRYLCQEFNYPQCQKCKVVFNRSEHTLINGLCDGCLSETYYLYG